MARTPKFKKGDRVVVVHTRDDGSRGIYDFGFEFIIDYVETYNSGIICFPKNGNGCYEEEIELAKVKNWKERIQNGIHN